YHSSLYSPSFLFSPAPATTSTSTLSLHDALPIFTVIRRLKAQGIVIVFVSHRLAEVFEIADRITIMRDGQLVGSYDRSAIDPEQDRKSTRLNSSHRTISYAVFCLKKKKKDKTASR